jgi:predicted nucleic acid-binding protein
VATRPANVNGLGLSFGQIETEVAALKMHYELIEETPAVFAEWEKLVSLHAIVGKNVHDAHLVAAMQVHGITHLLTFNKQDFHRFTSITVIAPEDTVTAQTP